MTEFGAQRFADVAALCVDLETMKSRLRLVLEDGSHVEMRDNYIQQMWNLLHNAGTVDSDWLRCSVNETYFVSQLGAKLQVVLIDPNGSRDEGSGGRGRDGARGEVSESLHIVLDQSSSMQDMQASAYQGARELVEALPPTATVHFTTFASAVSLGQAVARDDVIRILSSPPTASGQTALHDAIVQSINVARQQDGLVTVVIVTDGQDTCSRGTTREQVRACIQEFQRNALHRVLFLGTNQDAVVAAQAFGIPVQAALTFGTAPEHVRAAFRAASDNVRRMRAGNTTGFMTAERTMSVH